MRSPVLSFLRVPTQADLLDEDRLGSFREVYEASCEHIRKTLYWMVGPNAADDLVQETFLKVWKSLPKFRRDASTKTWIHRIAVNTAYDFLRTNKTPVSLTAVASESKSSPDYATKDLIRQGVFLLSPKQRSVFVLFYYQGFSVSECAETLKLPEGTVKSRLHGAREIFTAFLKKNGVSYE